MSKPQQGQDEEMRYEYRLVVVTDEKQETDLLLIKYAWDNDFECMCVEEWVSTDPFIIRRTDLQKIGTVTADDFLGLRGGSSLHTQQKYYYYPYPCVAEIFELLKPVMDNVVMPQE